MKELYIRRLIDASFREQVVQIRENDTYSLEISRLCFDRVPLEEVISLFQMKCTCVSLTIISCRGLGHFFDECRKLPNTWDVEAITLVNPTQDGIDALSSELLHERISTHSLNISSSITYGIATSLARTICGTDIQVLDLSHCFWDKRSVDTLARGFSQATTLHCLDISHCHLEDSLLAKIIRSLRNHPSLLDLGISFNNCNSEACASIGALLQSTKLERLKMAQQFIGRQKYLDIDAIIETIGQNSSLRFLDLKENFLGADQMERMLSALSENKTLEELDLSCTDISDESLSKLAGKFNAMRIQSISLRHNPFQNAEPLVNAAKTNYRLREVNVDLTVTSRAALYYYAALNKAGRSLMVDTLIPMSLWPRVFEKAGNMDLPEDLDFQACDILYYMIQGPAVLERE